MLLSSAEGSTTRFVVRQGGSGSACVYPVPCGWTQARSPFDSLELQSSLSIGHTVAIHAQNSYIVIA